MTPKILVKTLKSCEICNKSNHKADLYYCQTHKKAFCFDCYTNNGSRAYSFFKAGHCKAKYLSGDFNNSGKHNPDDDDCILIKIPQIEVQQ